MKVTILDANGQFDENNFNGFYQYDGLQDGYPKWIFNDQNIQKNTVLLG